MEYACMRACVRATHQTPHMSCLASGPHTAMLGLRVGADKYPTTSVYISKEVGVQPNPKHKLDG